MGLFLARVHRQSEYEDERDSQRFRVAIDFVVDGTLARVGKA